jgi:hypothetical protein
LHPSVTPKHTGRIEVRSGLPFHPTCYGRRAKAQRDSFRRHSEQFRSAPLGLEVPEKLLALTTEVIE